MRERLPDHLAVPLLQKPGNELRLLSQWQAWSSAPNLQQSHSQSLEPRLMRKVPTSISWYSLRTICDDRRTRSPTGMTCRSAAIPPSKYSPTELYRSRDRMLPQAVNGRLVSITFRRSPSGVGPSGDR